MRETDRQERAWFWRWWSCSRLRWYLCFLKFLNMWCGLRRIEEVVGSNTKPLEMKDKAWKEVKTQHPSLSGPFWEWQCAPLISAARWKRDGHLRMMATPGSSQWTSTFLLSTQHAPVISSVDSVQWLAIYWALAVCTGTSHPYLWATRMPACLSDSIVSSRALSSTVFLSNPPRSLLSHSWKVQLQQYGHWETKQMKRERETNRGLRVFFLAYQQDPLLIVSAG